MIATHVESGDKVVVHGDPRVHVVSWSNFRAWEAYCNDIVENWQPDYIVTLLADSDRSLVDNYTALQLQAAPDDAPVTCVGCLVIVLRHL